MHTIEDELRNPLITVLNQNDDLGHYEFLLGELQQPIRVELGRSPTSDETHYRRTHAIHTPLQAGPYYQSRYFWDDPAYALHQAITSLTQWYADAVRNGHQPKPSWLVKQDAA